MNTFKELIIGLILAISISHLFVFASQEIVKAQDARDEISLEELLESQGLEPKLENIRFLDVTWH